MFRPRGSRKVSPPPGREPGPPSAGPAGPGPGSRTGKGRPTPKRSEAQKARPRPGGPPPATRKEAYQRQKAETKVKRAQARQGMLRGEERYLSPRDRGPARRLVRDVVDSRRSAAVLFLPLAIVVFAGNFVHNARVQALISTLFLTTFLLIVVDLALLGRRLVTTLRRQFPEGYADRTRGLVFYGLTRATLFRRLRTPAPRVAVGDRP